MSGDITREQFASAVASVISSVHHLYSEVNHLIGALRERLAEEPVSLVPVSGTFPKAARDHSRVVVRNEYGLLFTAGTNDDESLDEDEELEEEVEEPEDEEVTAKGRKRTPACIASDEPLLAVAVPLYTPAKGQLLEPQIQYAVMSEWTVGKLASNPGQRFQLRRSKLRRVPKSIVANADLPRGASLDTGVSATVVGVKKSNDRRLVCRLPLGVEAVPLYSFDSPDALETLVQRIKRMWTEATRQP